MEEDQNEMSDEDCSSHRSSVFTLIAERKVPDEDRSSHRSSVFTRIAEKKISNRPTIELRLLFSILDRVPFFKTLTSLYYVRLERDERNKDHKNPQYS